MAADRTPSAFIRWEEVVVSSDDGKKETRYYLKRKDGSSTLAVVGKEKRLGRLSYQLGKHLRAITADSDVLKLRSRREVVDWLNSIVSGLDLHPYQGSAFDDSEDKDGLLLNRETVTDGQLRKLGKHTAEFVWLGSAVVCRKRRKHYQSFQRNTVKISVHDFVYVLAEEDKRLVAYLDDMYEDSKGNRMVVVRWFHYIDEVGIPISRTYGDREILFSLCLQDLNVECIDGFTSVLSPQHYKKFSAKAAHSQLEPFVCHRLFDNGDVEPFDITQVEGYAEQEILKHMFATSPSVTSMRLQLDNDDMEVEVKCPTDADELRPNKKLRRSKENAVSNPEALDVGHEVPDSIHCSTISKGGSQMCLPKEGIPISLTAKEVMQDHSQPLTLGAQVEVLSQDSGIRGCWFRALIIKKSKDKVKVRYLDIKDAADEVNNLEEWILGSRIAIPDKWSLRSCGRKIIRPAGPAPPLGNNFVAWAVKNGSVVDCWWHDGWWEGIVIQKESEDKFHVYFPAEKKVAIFALKDLRPSLEWLEAGWKQIKERPELVASIMSDVERKLNVVTSCDEASPPRQASMLDDDDELVSYVRKYKLSTSNKVSGSLMLQNLAEDDILKGLKWKSSRKRSGGRKPSNKAGDSDNKRKSGVKVFRTRTSEKYFIPSSLKVDRDNCKYTRDSAFSSVSPLTSLVWSR